MLIDWFTVGAQALNFLILVWLLKRFLYQPILSAIDAREIKIVEQLNNAEQVKQEANRAKTNFDNKNIAFEKQRDQLMEDATKAANAEKQRLQEEARQLADELITKQQKNLQTKMQALLHSIRNDAQKELFSIAQNVLRDLAAVDIESQILAVFLKKLTEIDQEPKRFLQAALLEKKIIILSSGSFSEEQKNTIEKSLKSFLLDNNKADKQIEIQFKQSAALIAGIELITDGYKIGWSITEYLQTLEDTLNKHINMPVMSSKS